MKNLTMYFFIAFFSICTYACKEPIILKCDNSEGLQILKNGIKKRIIECYALKLASADYEVSYYSYKYSSGWFSSGEMSDDYEKYLQKQLPDILNHTGEYYQKATDQLVNMTIEIEGIFDENAEIYAIEKPKMDINRCSCEAQVKINNGYREDVSYELKIDESGSMWASWRYHPTILIDDETDAFTFIQRFKKNQQHY